MEFFKQFSVIIIGAISCAASFIASTLMYERVYGKNAPSFARLRGGPAIGTALGFLSAFVNLEALRVQKKELSTNDFILALSMAFLSIGAGVLFADMRRGWKKEK